MSPACFDFWGLATTPEVILSHFQYSSLKSCSLRLVSVVGVTDFTPVCS